jgi:putative membrane protein
LKGIIFGIVFGATSPIPGVSGGSLAVFANVFEDFFLSASWSGMKKNILFIAAFIAGTACGLYGVSHGIAFLLNHYGQILLFAFMGLILGCTPSIYKKAKAQEVNYADYTVLVLAFALMVVLAIIGGDSTNSTLEQLGGVTPGLLAWFFAASFFSSIAILIPGVGGSIMMLAFGIYAVYIEAMQTLNPVILAVLVPSMVLGIIAGIKIIRQTLISAPGKLYCAILGFMLGSLFVVYPGFSFDLTGALSAVSAVGCAFLAVRLSREKGA